MAFCVCFVLLGLYENSKPGGFLQVTGVSRGALPRCGLLPQLEGTCIMLGSPSLFCLNWMLKLFTVYRVVWLKLQFKLIS